MEYKMLWDIGHYLHLAPVGYYYEFGVCTGKAIDIMLDMTEGTSNWSEITKRIDKRFLGVIGFDSFTGLPKESPEVWQNPEWPEGAFSSLEVFNVKSIPEAIAELYKKWEKYSTKVELVEGYYNDSLTDELGESLKNKQASFVHIDCDIYLSTVQAMDWIFKHDLAMKDSIWRFDDWISTPEWTAGESKAFLEISQKYKLKWNRLQTNIFQFVEKE